MSSDFLSRYQAYLNTHPDPYQEGRLPMSDAELKLVERNRMLTRNVMVPIMSVIGLLGLIGGLWIVTAEASIVGIGLTTSALAMIGLAVFYYLNTQKPIVRLEKFFVTGIVTDHRKTGGLLTNIYYRVKLNDGRYTGFITKEDFRKCQRGDIIRCERLDETSVNVHRVENIGKI